MPVTAPGDDIDARTKANATPGYDGFCRDRDLARSAGALRFRVPDTGTTVVHDLIRGDVTFAHEALEDFVVVRSNGAPLFVLANVVDDIAMGITHVIRGEELLPSTPKGLLLWGVLEGDDAVLPAFAHLPLLVNERRQKLSKRRDDVAMESYRARGYVAEAMRNYLALLGWSDPQGREILSADELVARVRAGRRQPRPRLLRPAQAGLDEQAVPDRHVRGGLRGRGAPVGDGARSPVVSGSLRRSPVRGAGPARPGARQRARRGPRDGRLRLR